MGYIYYYEKFVKRLLLYNKGHRRYVKRVNDWKILKQVGVGKHKMLHRLRVFSGMSLSLKTLEVVCKLFTYTPLMEGGSKHPSLRVWNTPGV